MHSVKIEGWHWVRTGKWQEIRHCNKCSHAWDVHDDYFDRDICSECGNMNSVIQDRNISGKTGRWHTYHPNRKGFWKMLVGDYRWKRVPEFKEQTTGVIE